MQRNLTIFLLLFSLLSPLAPPLRAAVLSAGIEFDKVDGTTVQFKIPDGVDAPSSIKTELHDLTYLGVLKQEAHPPFFIFTGRPCQTCLQETAVYLLRPSNGKPLTFVHPGKVFDPKSRALLLESRAFFGRCLRTNPSDVYVVFQKERVDRRSRLQQSVFIAEPRGVEISERLLERGLPRLDHTLRLVRSKACQEITGRNRMMLTKPLDLNPRRGVGEDDDSDSSKEERTKENQTDRDLTPQNASQ